MDLYCYETMSNIQCPEINSHDQKLRMAEAVCIGQQARVDVSRRQLEAVFGDAMNARRQHLAAERTYRQLQQDQRMANSLVQEFSYSAGPGRHSSEFEVERARRARESTDRRQDDVQCRVESAERDLRAAENEHARCDFCCFRIFCGSCGVSIRR